MVFYLIFVEGFQMGEGASILRAHYFEPRCREFESLYVHGDGILGSTLYIHTHIYIHRHVNAYKYVGVYL